MACGVLVVEDDPDLRQMLAELLTAEGFVAEVAENGQAALDALSGGLRPRVILLDLMMPVMDGFEFRIVQRSQPAIASIPIVVLTAAAERAQPLQAVATLRKPIDFAKLIATLRACC
jgi:CheY-like chemotaxis protein